MSTAWESSSSISSWIVSRSKFGRPYRLDQADSCRMERMGEKIGPESPHVRWTATSFNRLDRFLTGMTIATSGLACRSSRGAASTPWISCAQPRSRSSSRYRNWSVVPPVVFEFLNDPEIFCCSTTCSRGGSPARYSRSVAPCPTSFYGKTFVLTGTYQAKRSETEHIIKQLGGKTSGRCRKCQHSFCRRGRGEQARKGQASRRHNIDGSRVRADGGALVNLVDEDRSLGSRRICSTDRSAHLRRSHGHTRDTALCVARIFDSR